MPLWTILTKWPEPGGPGAGHYVKMVHNGIEYGLMQAYAEGFELLEAAAAGPSSGTGSTRAASTATKSASTRKRAVKKA